MAHEECIQSLKRIEEQADHYLMLEVNRKWYEPKVDWFYIVRNLRDEARRTLTHEIL